MVFKTEAVSIDFIRSRVDRATTINADETADWNVLHGRFDTKRIVVKLVAKNRPSVDFCEYWQRARAA